MAQIRVHRTRLLAGALLAFATAMAALSMLSPPAHAQTGLSLNPGDLLGKGLGATVSDLACKPTRTLTAPLGELATAVSQLVCNADLLDYTVYTVYRRPDGSQVTRETRATLLLPTLVNVDDDILPELLVTLQPLSTSRFRISIARMPLVTLAKALPVSVEIVASDPTKGSLPRQKLALGYDARTSRAPGSFLEEVGVGASASTPGATTVGIGWAAEQAGPSLAVTGGLFDGAVAARANPVGARLTYGPTPGKGGIDLVVGGTLGARLTVSRPAAVTLDAESVQGSHEVRVHGVVDRLPSSTEVTYIKTGSAARLVTYAAAAPVDRAEIDYRDRTGDKLDEHVLLAARGLPTGLRLEQTGPGVAALEASGGQVDQVEAGFANGEVQLLERDATPYVHVVEQGGVQSYAARVRKLARARLDASGPIVVDAQFGASTPFDVVVGRPGLRADVQVRDLPRHTLTALDLAAGRLDVDGFGERIGRVTFDVASDSPLFERVRRLSGSAERLGPKVAVAYKPLPGQAVSIRATEPVGALELLLASGDHRPLRDGRAGLRVEDTPTHFATAARLFDVRTLSFTPGTELRATGQVRGGPFTLEYGDADVRLSGEVLDIPDEFDVRVAPRETRFELATGKGGPEIAVVDLDLQTSTPLVGPANRLRVKVEGVPQPLILTVKPEGEDTVFDASKPLRRVEALLTSGVEIGPGGDPNDRGLSSVHAHAVDSGSCCNPGFAVAARVNGFRSMRVASSSARMAFGLGLAERQRLHVSAEVNVDGDAVDAEGRVNVDAVSLPTSFEAAVNFANALVWNGSDGIGSVTLLGENLPGAKGAPHFVRGELVGLPASFTLGLNAGAGMELIGLRSAGGPLHEVEMDVADQPDRFGRGGLPADRNTVRLATGPSTLEVHVRAFDVKQAQAGKSFGGWRAGLELGERGRAPRFLDVFYDDVSPVDGGERRQHAEFHLPRPPRHLEASANVSDSGVQFKYDAFGESFPEASFRTITAKPAPPQGQLKIVDESAAEVRVADLPPKLDFCFDTSRAGCMTKAPVQFRVRPCAVEFTCRLRAITQFNDLTTYLETTGATKRVTANVNVCHGTSLFDHDPMVLPCLTRGDQFDFVRITNLRAKRFRFEFADSESVERSGDGPVDGDLLKLYLHTDDEGINVERLETYKRDRDKRFQVIANDLGSSIVAKDAFRVLDTSPPNVQTEVEVGYLKCNHIEFRAFIPLVGTTDAEPLLPICD